MIELNKRKDDTIGEQKDNIERLYEKIKDYLLTQDQLYKDYVRLERSFKRKEETLKK